MMKYIFTLLALGITPFLFSQERPLGDKEVSDEVERPERKSFPKHWGAPPRLQTRDIRPLPGGFGMGSSTLAAWIKENIEADQEKEVKPPQAKPKPSLPVRPDPRVEEYRNLEKALAGHKAEAAKAERDLEVKIAKANKNPDKREVEIHVKNLVARHDAAMKGHEREAEHIESRLAELKKIPEVAICIFPPKPKPSLPVRPKPPKEIKKKLDNIKRIQALLREGLKKELDALGDGATKEEVRETVQEFQKENASRLEDVRHLSKQVQEWQKENRPTRPKRPEPTAEVKEKIKNVHEKQKDLAAARHVLREQLHDTKDLSKEDRADLIKKFKEENAGKHKALKEAQKALAQEVREKAQTKDRRE